MKTFRLSNSRLVLALVAAGVIGGAGVDVLKGLHHDANAAVNPVVATTTDGTSSVGPVSTIAMPNFAAIAEQQGAAVVNISVVGKTPEKVAYQSQGNGSDDGSDDPFQEFFRRFGIPQVPQGMNPQQSTPSRAEGSGFIVSSDGLILTNAHVVKDADEVTVKLTDRREFVAKVLGADTRTDVAVLRIDAKNLPVVPLGSPQDLKVGEWVLAIGSPFGFENSVTAGVVSAKGRSLPDDSYVPFIQTDVAINPGNSGGPLFNAKGEVVGINSQIYSRSGGYQGLSFSIPINVALQVKDDIVAHGHARHARLGVTIQEVNQTLADSFKLDKPRGALVSSIQPDGPAAKAGLKAGDVILSMDGKPIDASADLPALVGQSTPGKKVDLQVWREGKSQTVSATLGNADDKVAKADENSTEAPKGKLGLALRPLQPDEKRSAGIATGMVIEGVQGPAAKAGIQPGDVLLAINGKPVQDIDQVRAQVEHSKKSLALLIQRDGQQIFVPVKLG